MKFRVVLLSLVMFSFIFGQEIVDKQIVPDFTFKSITGEEVTLSKYTSDKDVTFLVFFTTWCPWCTKQMEVFEKMSYENSKNISFVAITIEDDVKKISNKIKSIGVTFPVVLGGSDIAQFFKISGIPVTVILNSKREKIEQIIGFRDNGYFKNYLKE